MDIPIAFIDLENRDLEIELPVAIEIHSFNIEIITPEIRERPVTQEVSLNPFIWHCWCCILCIIFFILIIYILVGLKIVLS
jgi:hypothetical protein